MPAEIYPIDLANSWLTKIKAANAKTQLSFYSLQDSALDVYSGDCPKDYALRPLVVCFDETVLDHDKAVSVLRDATVFIVSAKTLTV